MEYAGAQRPLWIIRNDEGILIEIKADKFSIGGDQTESERKFTKQTISLLKGDCMYIFSDGLVDQFGGADGKKFMTKQFKNWLIENHKLPMIEQGAKLESYFYKWKGNYEQVDDISVIGIRI
jgi:serine phosphatase RsbU (regulator of sigma subunit)